MNEDQNTTQPKAQEKNEPPLNEIKSETSSEGTNERPATEQAQTSNAEPKPETMEVHHHPHITHQKKWKEYVFQFLMLFLAVFCGFLAEYQLEHVIENRREVQFIKSFLGDLELDTFFYSRQISARESKERKIDSLISLIKSTDRNSYMQDIYYHAQMIQRGNSFPYSDRTIQQLKSSGGMRLIRNKDASDSIMLYDSRVRNMQYFEEAEVVIKNDYRKIVGLLFDASIVHSMIDENRLIKPKGDLKLLTEDPGIINQLCIQAHYLRTGNHQILIYLIQRKHNAILVSEYLKKVYHLE